MAFSEFGPGLALGQYMLVTFNVGRKIAKLKGQPTLSDLQYCLPCIYVGKDFSRIWRIAKAEDICTIPSNVLYNAVVVAAVMLQAGCPTTIPLSSHVLCSTVQAYKFYLVL